MLANALPQISSPEALCILNSTWLSLNSSPVMNLFDRWFDIRRMTAGEVKDFTGDFMREMAGEIHAGVTKPH
jgi:hypothetical protein